MALVPPKLKFKIYMTGQFDSRALISERSDVKSRARSADLESRRAWQAGSFIDVLGDVRALSPLNVRGREIELSTLRSWNPRFSIFRCEIHGRHMDVDVRPSRPYRDCVRANLEPVTRGNDASHLGRKLDNARTRRLPEKLDPSLRSQSVNSRKIPAPTATNRVSTCDQSRHVSPLGT